mgnify:FL=1
MTIIEFKGWIEDLVNQVSSTDWWANGIAIFCAIIGVTVPIIYEMYQRKQGDDKINATIKKSLEELALISKELKKQDDIHSSDRKYLIRRRFESRNLYRKLLRLFKALDELIILKKNEKNISKIDWELDELISDLPNKRIYITKVQEIVYEIANLKKPGYDNPEIYEDFVEQYIELKFQILEDLD